MIDVLPFIESEVVCITGFYIVEPFNYLFALLSVLGGLYLAYIILFTGVMPRP